MSEVVDPDLTSTRASTLDEVSGASPDALVETPAEAAIRQKRTAAQHAKRVAIFVAGMAVVVAGIVMLVLPGPGLLVIVAGLSILAIEFAWAQRLRDQAKDRAAAAATKARNGLSKRSTKP